MTLFSRRGLKRLGTAVLGALLVRYPVWAMLVDAGSIQKIQPWTDHFKLLCSWDCAIYAKLSQSYTPSNAAFFPGFPLLLHGLRLIFPAMDGRLAALIVSNLFTVIAGVLVLYIGDAIWTRNGDRKLLSFSYKSWLFLLLLSLFPTAHFWVRGFTEPVFATLLLLVIWFVQQNLWDLAAISAGLSAVIRPQGVWVAFILYSYLLFTSIGSLGKENRKSVFFRLVRTGLWVAIPFVCFVYWQWAQTGDPLHFLHLQTQGWGRKFSLMGGIWAHLPRFDTNVFFLYLSLWAGFRLVKRRENHWRVLGLITLAMADLPLFVGGFYSYTRFLSTNIGMFVCGAEVLENRPAWAVAFISWETARLAIDAYHAGFGLWVG